VLRNPLLRKAAKRIAKNRNKKYNFEIEGGGHFFTLTHETEINKILKQEL
jgi:pimeloyl-ACP methyl ester carboxylesterase